MAASSGAQATSAAVFWLKVIMWGGIALMVYLALHARFDGGSGEHAAADASLAPAGHADAPSTHRPAAAADIAASAEETAPIIAHPLPVADAMPELETPTAQADESPPADVQAEAIDDPVVVAAEQTVALEEAVEDPSPPQAEEQSLPDAEASAPPAAVAESVAQVDDAVATLRVEKGADSAGDVQAEESTVLVVSDEPVPNPELLQPPTDVEPVQAPPDQSVAEVADSPPVLEEEASVTLGSAPAPKEPEPEQVPADIGVEAAGVPAAETPAAQSDPHAAMAAMMQRMRAMAARSESPGPTYGGAYPQRSARLEAPAGYYGGRPMARGPVPGYAGPGPSGYGVPGAPYYGSYGQGSRAYGQGYPGGYGPGYQNPGHGGMPPRAYSNPPQGSYYPGGYY